MLIRGRNDGGSGGGRGPCTSLTSGSGHASRRRPLGRRSLTPRRALVRSFSRPVQLRIMYRVRVLTLQTRAVRYTAVVEGDDADYNHAFGSSSESDAEKDSACGTVQHPHPHCSRPHIHKSALHACATDSRSGVAFVGAKVVFTPTGFARTHRRWPTRRRRQRLGQWSSSISPRGC